MYLPLKLTSKWHKPQSRNLEFGLLFYLPDQLAQSQQKNEQQD